MQGGIARARAFFLAAFRRPPLSVQRGMDAGHAGGTALGVDVDLHARADLGPCVSDACTGCSRKPRLG